jgi:hypothetical protein
MRARPIRRRRVHDKAADFCEEAGRDQHVDTEDIYPAQDTPVVLGNITAMALAESERSKPLRDDRRQERITKLLTEVRYGRGIGSSHRTDN